MQTVKARNAVGIAQRKQSDPLDLLKHISPSAFLPICLRISTGATMSSGAEDCSIPGGTEQDAAAEEKSTIKIIEPWNFSRPISRPNSLIVSSELPGTISQSPQILSFNPDQAKLTATFQFHQRQAQKSRTNEP